MSDLSGSSVVVGGTEADGEPEGMYSLIVLTPDGDPLADAFVTLSGAEDFAAFGATNDRGSLVLETRRTGPCTVAVNHPHYPVSSKTMQLSSGRFTETIRMQSADTDQTGT